MENLICCTWALRRPSTIFASNTSLILWNGMIWYVRSIDLPVAGEEPIDSFWGKSRYRPSLDISKIHGKFWVTESELEMSSLQISSLQHNSPENLQSFLFSNMWSDTSNHAESNDNAKENMSTHSQNKIRWKLYICKLKISTLQKK